jgi:hypothetical protein
MQAPCVQEKGRSEIFEDYRLRVGEVTDDSEPPQGLPVVQQRFDETANPKGQGALNQRTQPV